MRQIVVDFNTVMSEPVDLVKFNVATDEELTRSAHVGEIVLLVGEEMQVEAELIHLPQYGNAWLASPLWSTEVRTELDASASH